MADTVRAAEAPRVFPAMLATSRAGADHIAVGVREAWMQHDAGQAAPFMAALTASLLKRESFEKLLARGIVDPKLATLLPLGAPTKGQLLVALTIAVQDGKAKLPQAVRDFLRAAAGGTPTSTFPAALGVGALIAPVGEIAILETIGLAPSSPPPSPPPGGATVVDGNVDADHNNKNETYVSGTPREATVTGAKLDIRSRASAVSNVIAVVRAGDVLRVMGDTSSGWSFVDHNGTMGFVTTRFIT